MRAIFKIVASSVLAIFAATVEVDHAATTISWFDVRPAVAMPVSDRLPVQTSNLPKFISDEEAKHLKCLADNIYYEARGEPTVGQAAVARVVMARVNDPRFPTNPCSVIYQRSSKGCQFSWVCTPKKPPKKHIWDDAWQIAVDVYLYGRYNEIAKGALYFNTLGMRPTNKSKKVTKIGNHYFYSG